MPEKFETNERQPQQPEELFVLIDEVAELVGPEPPMVSDPDFQPGSAKPVTEILDPAREAELKMRAKEMVTYDTMAKLSVQQHMLERAQIERNPEVVDQDHEKVDPIDEISYLMTLWEYQQAHLKDFVHMAQAYRAHLEKYPEESEKIREDSNIIAWENQLKATLVHLQQTLPVLEKMHRMSKYEYLLEQDKNKPRLGVEEKEKLTALVQWLKEEMYSADTKDNPVFKDIDLSSLKTASDIRQAHDTVEAKFRKLLAQTVEVDIRGSGAKLDFGEERTMRLGQALYVRLLSLHRDQSIEGIKSEKSPSVEQYLEFMELQGELNRISMQHLVRETKLNADMQGLLATMTHFGPRTGPLASNPEAAGQFAEYFQKYVLPAEIKDQFKLEEFARSQAGMEGYLQLVEGDVLRYGKWMDALSQELVDEAQWEHKAITIRHGIVKWSYIVPENTLGLMRFAGLDYADMFGFGEEMRNHRQVEEFIQLDQSVEGIEQLIEEQKPGIDASIAEVRTAAKDLADLRTEYPPGQCKPGQVVNGKTYEEIEQMYVDAIEDVRESHKVFCEKIDTLYQELEKLMGYHINHMAQNRLLNNQNSPHPYVGIGITSAEALTVAAWLYGGKRGLRGMPGVAQATGLKWIHSPTKGPIVRRMGEWMLKRVVNAPIRILNAPTRLVISRIPGLRNIRSRWDVSPKDMTAMERELEILRARTAQAVSETPRETPGTRRGQEALESVSQNPKAIQALEDIAEIEAKIATAQGDMADLLTRQGSMTAEDFAKAQDSIIETLIKHNAELRSARIRAARQVLGRRLPFWIGKNNAIIEAHRAATVAEKTSVLKQAKFTPDEISRLLETGVCGDTSTGLTRMRNATTLAEGVDETVDAFAKAGVSNMDDVLVASGRIEGATVRGLSQQEKMLVRRWWNSPVFRKMLHYGGVAIQGYIVYSDILALQEAERHHQEAQKNAKKHLDGLVANKESGWILDGDTYKYKDKVSIRLQDIGSNTALNANNWRLAVDATSLAIMVSMGARAFAGPPGWILIGAEITIHTAISAWERSEYYDFIKNVDPALLAYLGGTAATIGPHEYNVLEDAFVDIFPLGKDLEVRKRIVYSWFMTHLARSNREHYHEIVGTKSYDGLGEFFEKDFQTHILPYMQTHLMMHANATLDRDFLTKLDVTRIFNVISKKDMESSFASAADWYVLHLREQRYLEVLQLEEGETDPELRVMLRSQAYELGSKYVYGRRLMDMKDELRQNNGRTRASLLAERMRKQLSEMSGDGGTWLDVVNNQDEKNGYVAKHKPLRIVDVLSGETTGYAPHLSTGRDFTFDVTGIAGITPNEEYEGRMWYSETMRGTSTPKVPKVEDAVPDVSGYYIPNLYESMVLARDEAVESREGLLSRQRALERLNSLIFWTSKVDEKKNMQEALQHEIDAEWAPKVSEILNARAERGVPYFGAAPLRRAENKIAELTERIAEVHKERQQKQNYLDQYVAEHMARYPEYAEYKDMSLSELTARYGELYTAYLLDLEMAEWSGRYFDEQYAHMRGVTSSADEHASAAEIRFAGPEERVTKALYPNTEEPPLLLVSPEVTVATEVDTSHLAHFTRFPELMQSGRPYDAFGSDRLLAIHIHKEVQKDGTVEYLATYAYSKYPDNTEPEADDVFYIQVGGVAKEGSGHMELGLPQRVIGDRANAYFEVVRYELAEWMEQKEEVRLAQLSRGEMLFRAGDIMNELVQVSRNEWAVRFRRGKQDFLYVLRLQAGKLQCKQLSYAVNPEGNYQTWLRENGEYTEDEKSFARRIAKDVEAVEWGEVPKELIEKFNLQSADPKEFTGVVQLPFDQFTGEVPFGGVAGIEQKLVLNLDPQLVRSMDSIIENITLKLDAVNPAFSGPLRDMFVAEIDRLMSVRSEELRTATPQERVRMLTEIMNTAAQKADTFDQTGASSVSQNLENAFLSEGWSGGY